MDAERVSAMQGAVEAGLSPESKQQIMQLLSQIDNLNGAEKLLLYLKLPTGPPPVDPLKQPINPLGSRSEIQQTVMWIQTHLEVDPEISLPKKDVYEEYTDYCTSTKMKPLSTADFGKVMKQVYPCVKPRRLGTRGHSRYCYAGMRKRIKLEVPQLPDLGEKPKALEMSTNHSDAASCVIKEWAEKNLALKFGSLEELARYLLEKNHVDHSSTAARTILKSVSGPSDIEISEHEDSFEDKNSDVNKIPQRGVIKQLKRKIQAQPHIAFKSLKNSKSFEESTDVEDSSESGQLNSNYVAEQNFSVKTEADIISSAYNPHSSALVSRNKDYIANIESSTELSPSQLRTFNPDFCKEYPQNAAVNLTQSSFSRGRSPQFLGPGVKNASLIHRPGLSNYDIYKYDSLYTSDGQPTSLRVNSFAMCDSENVYSQNPSNLVPINLSNSNAESGECQVKTYKAALPYKSLDSQCPQLRNDSLNLSIGRRDNWIAQDTPAVAVKFPLPGKKMILETYNANQNILSNVNCNEQNLKPPQSPDKGQYLPKKMRATENFGNKLTSSRFHANSSSDLQHIEPDKYNKAALEEFAQPLAKSSQNIVPNSNLAVNFDSSITNQPVSNQSSPTVQPHCLNPSNVVDCKSSAMESDKIQYISKRNQKNLKYNKRAKTKSPDPSTNSLNNNVDFIQNLPVKTTNRGRPRKKSLSKAKYSKRMPRAVTLNLPQCEHKHPKRSSDSCSSLTESINIKTGIICAENHSEILNRERVSSICNMDKHALDDYLNEGNSQEHEEELMRYFQPNEDNANTENASKDDLESIESSPLKVGKVNTLDITGTVEKLESNTPATSGVITSTVSNCSTKEINLDVNEDHSQGKCDKISQLREILQKNLKHNNNNSVSSGILDAEKNNSTGNGVCGFPHTVDGSESAFATITRRKIDGVHDNFEYKEVSAAASLTMLSMKQQCNANERPNTIAVRRRVSFENPTKMNNEMHDIPPSPTSRLQQFNFMPISSPGRSSPISKNSPVVSSYKSGSPSKNIPVMPCTSPVSLSSTASPFVSPRNTPVPRARNTCHEKPVPSNFKSKKLLPRLGLSKCTYMGDKMQRDTGNINHTSKNGQNELGNFIIPNDHSTIPRSPSYMPKVRTFPMSAPPSPNILTSKYKPNFSVQCQTSSPHIVRSMSQDITNSPVFIINEPLAIPNLDSVHNEQSQPLSADPHSHEISQFFNGNNVCLDDANNSLRSQSVPLHQNGMLLENQGFYNHNQSNNAALSNITYLSYNNTPCSSVPPTPIPKEFCDFGSLNDTCESISKGLNSENLNTLYNVLNSNSQEVLINKVVEQNGMLLGNVNAENISMASFNQNDSLLVDLEPMMFENSEDLVKIPFEEQLPQEYRQQPQMLPTDDTLMKRSNSTEVNITDTPIDGRFFMSRSVPSTPLPGMKTQLPSFDQCEQQLVSHGQQFQDEYGKRTNNKTLISKSVPSTPQITDDRNMFNYSNRDFLINGNSVDPNLSNAFNDKKIQNDQLEQSFLNDSSSLIEDKSSSVLVGFPNSPLPETIDMVNNELAPFNDDCMNMDTENDLLDNIL